MAFSRMIWKRDDGIDFHVKVKPRIKNATDSSNSFNVNSAVTIKNAGSSPFEVDVVVSIKNAQ